MVKAKTRISRRDGQHHKEGTKNGDGAGRNLQKVVGQRGGDGVDVVGKAADDVAGLVPVKKADRQFQELIDQILSHLIGDALAELGHQNGKHIGQRRRNDVEDKHQKAVEINLVKVRHPRLGADGVDGVAGKRRAQQRQQVAGNGQRDCAQHHPLMRKDVARQAQDDMLFAARFWRNSIVWYHPKSPPI